MRAILKALLEIIYFRLRSRASLELEVIALRHQLKMMKLHQKTRLYVPRNERLLWIILYRFWRNAARLMVVVKPKTVVRWHREGFKYYWRWKSLAKGGVEIRFDVRDLALRMRAENPLWGYKRIHAEILKLGINVSWATVRRYLKHTFCAPHTPPGWKIFLRNHMHETVAADLFVVITKSYRLLYVVVFLELRRRRIRHFEVTYHPTQEWLADQASAAFERGIFKKGIRPRYLLRDRDSSYGAVFRDRVRSLGIEERVTNYKSPWQNVHVERLIYTVRRECLNHIIALNERHLRGILREYVIYYNQTRPHWALDYDAPESRPIHRPYRGKKIIAISHVGGLHHRYERRAA